MRSEDQGLHLTDLMALQEEEERGLSLLTCTKESIMKTQQESDPLPARKRPDQDPYQLEPQSWTFLPPEL